MKIATKTNHILTGFLPSGNGGSWYMNEKNEGFLSPITINRMTIKAKIGDIITIETNSPGYAQKVYVNGQLAFND